MKKSILLLSGIALIALSLSACHKEPETTKIVLSAPVVTATADGASVTLKWQAVTNATSYKVEYKESSAADYSVAGTPTYSPYSITGLEFGSSYDFRVKALAKDVESEYSQVVSVSLERSLTPPVISTSSGITFIDVKWDAVENATSYTVEHKPSMETSWITDYTGNGEDAGYAFKIPGLSGGVTYDVRVAALAAGYSTTYSEISTITTTAEPSTMISTGAQFATWLSSVTIDTRDVAALANDIDMAGITITSAPSFGGMLEGQGFAIKNLKSSVPLFQTNNGTFNNLVIDESCEFTVPEGTQIFGALVASDQRGTYTLVKNRASVTYKATKNITDQLIIGGLIGKLDGGQLSECSNSGAVKIDATGYSHLAVGLGGLIGYAGVINVTNCTNRGPVTLIADYGKANSTLEGFSNAGINVGGLFGCAYDYGTDNASYFEQCVNEAEGVVTVSYTKYEALPDENKSCYVSVGGILGRARGSMKKCKNFAPINVAGISSDRTETKRRNFTFEIGGIAGAGRWALCFESCSNDGAISFDTDGTYDSNERQVSAVGGICGWEDYAIDEIAEDGSADLYAYYCKNRGNITVTGHGVTEVGGIFGFDGKQIGNEVIDCTIDYTGSKGYVGGLAGQLSGSQDAYVIKRSSCSATIKAERYQGDDHDYFAVGGLVGGWAGAQGSCLLAREDVPCSFSGSVSSTTAAASVGIVIGFLKGDNKPIRFGDSDNPIRVSGQFGNKDLAITPITADILTEHAVGKKPAGDQWSINVVLAQ